MATVPLVFKWLVSTATDGVCVAWTALWWCGLPWQITASPDLRVVLFDARILVCFSSRTFNVDAVTGLVQPCELSAWDICLHVSVSTWTRVRTDTAELRGSGHRLNDGQNWPEKLQLIAATQAGDVRSGSLV